MPLTTTSESLIVFHQGIGRNGELWYNVIDGEDRYKFWKGDTKVDIGKGMSAGPGAVMVKNDAYVFHKGPGDSNNDLYYNVHVLDRTYWTGDNKVPYTGITGSPCAVYYHDKIYCIHAGLNADLRYNVLDPETKQWVGDLQVPNTRITLGPSATVFNDKIYCFHQGENSNGELWYNVFDGVSWEGDMKVPNTGMSAEPASVVFNNKLHCFHQGLGESGELWYNVYEGDGHWLGDRKVPNTKGLSEGPSTVEFDSKLYCFYRNNDELYYNFVDGLDWSQYQLVPSTGMSGTPSAIVWKPT